MTADDNDGRADDEVFHPLGEDWQDGVERELEETEYDAELGMEMAKDAMRVTKGELSEEEFYDRYHEDVMEEFGEDERPVATGDDEEQGRLESALSRVGMDEESRRDVMKKMGGAGAIGFGAWGYSNGGSDEPPAVAAQEEQESEEHDDTGGEEGTQWGMALDLEYCDGCLSCVVACAEEHDWNQGANWMYILDWEDGTPGSEDSNNRLIRPCQHCTDAPCEKVCPTTARHTRDSDGLVLTDYNVCIGCRYCQVACPYGVNYFQWEEPEVPESELDPDHVYDERGRPVSARAPRGVMEKCTFCPTRQDGSKGEEFIGRTACEDACPPEVIQFGDMNDPNSDPQRYLENTAKARTLVRVAGDLDPATIEEDLQGADGDGDPQSIIDAVEDLDEETLALLLAIAIVTEEVGEPEHGANETLAEQEATALEVVGLLEDAGLDTESEELLVELELAEESGEDEEFGGPSEDLAQERLQDFGGEPQSTYKLLEDIGTDPNVVYLGNEPGAHAHQVEGPVAYEDVDQTDVRMDVLEEGTFGPRGPSL